MDMEQMREYYRRFRRWQLEPFHYANHSDGEVVCQNCGTTFDGNFCPICGQKAGVGRITWQTLREGVMILWGMDSRSLPYTIVQLLLRPGYLIGDYISGRRQVSFPPVKMLFILTIVDWLVIEAKKLLGLSEEVVTVKLDVEDVPEEAATRMSAALEQILGWIDANEGWAMLLLTGMFILPTWMLFRRSPRHARHTLPEGFFIQVFLVSILVIIGILHEIVPMAGILIPIYYFAAYRQLFGYGAWGTLWRLTLCIAISLILLIISISAITIALSNSYFR